MRNKEQVKCPECGSEKVTRTGLSHGVGNGIDIVANKIGHKCLECQSHFIHYKS